VHRDLATDHPQRRQLLDDCLGVCATRGERLPQLRLLLRKRRTLLDQLVVGMVQVVDEQCHAGIVLGGQRASDGRL